jgi:hypothetical protein
MPSKKPWTIGPSESTTVYIPDGDPADAFEGISIFDADGNQIAIIPDDWYIGPLVRENARLIAAAPDLLAALKSFRHADGCFCEAAFAGSGTIVRHTAECEAACAAIEKAENDEPSN